MTGLIDFVIAVLAVGTIAQTITKASVFMPLRVYLRAHAPWPGKLVTCSYCTSHWAAFGVVLFVQPNVIDAWGPAAFFVQAFAIVALAQPVGWLIRHVITFTPDPDTIDAQLDAIFEEVK